MTGTTIGDGPKFWIKWEVTGMKFVNNPFISGRNQGEFPKPSKLLEVTEEVSIAGRYSATEPIKTRTMVVR
jgi:hypothetical protein